MNVLSHLLTFCEFFKKYLKLKLQKKFTNIHVSVSQEIPNLAL